MGNEYPGQKPPRLRRQKRLSRKLTAESGKHFLRQKRLGAFSFFIFRRVSKPYNNITQKSLTNSPPFKKGAHRVSFFWGLRSALRARRAASTRQGLARGQNLLCGAIKRGLTRPWLQFFCTSPYFFLPLYFNAKRLIINVIQQTQISKPKLGAFKIHPNGIGYEKNNIKFAECSCLNKHVTKQYYI